MSQGVRLSEESFLRLRRVVEWAEANMAQAPRAAPPPLGVEVDILRVTGAVDGSGNYPAVVTYYDGSAWQDYAVAVKLRPANGEALSSGTRYPARPIGEASGTPLYVGAGATAAGLTVREVDGSPSIAAGTLELHQDDFTVTDQTGGVARVRSKGRSGNGYGLYRDITQGNYYVAGSETGKLTLSGFTCFVDKLMAVPFVPHGAGTVTIDRIAFYVSTAVASAKGRAGVYTTHSTATNLQPATLLLDGGEMDCSTTGLKAATVSQDLTAGQLYWLVLLASHAIGAHSINLDNCRAALGVTWDSAPYGWHAWSATQTYGALPASYPGGGVRLSSFGTGSHAPAIGVRYSA